MILDSSAVLAVVLAEPEAQVMLGAMSQADALGIGAATYLETLIVAFARQGQEAADDVAALLSEVECEVLPLNEGHTAEAFRAWRRFGRGHHPAKLNFGDCLAYATARSAGRPLLAKGDDFPQTDIALVL